MAGSVANLPQTPLTHQQFLNRVAVLALLVSVILLLVILSIGRRRPTPTQTQTRSPIVVETPQSFTDFIGPVSAVTPAGLEIQMTIVGAGAATIKTYRVAVDDRTAVQSAQYLPTGPSYKPLAVKDIKVGDRIQVFGSNNLAALTEFTATKILKILPAS